MEKCDRKIKFDQWKNMNSGQNIKSAVEYFMECPQDELLELEKDRHIFSFRNGIFITKINKVMKYLIGVLFVKYGKEASSCEYLTKNSVSSKYFDNDFNTEELDDDQWLI